MAVVAPREQLQILAHDLRYGVRSLRNTPGFAFAALFVIALGVAATATVFSLVNAVLIRSLPYQAPERLVYMWTPIPQFKEIFREISPPYADLFDWRKMSHSFTGITALQQRIVLLGDQNLERAGCALVLGNFFETLNAVPELGRTIDDNDNRPGQQRVAVIGDGIWRTRFGGNSDVLEKTIQIDDLNYRVIGIMPNAFGYPHGSDFPSSQFEIIKRTDVWIPAALNPKQQWDRTSRTDAPDAVIGRLRPGVTLKQAQAEMSAIETHLAPLYPAEFRGVQSLLVPFLESAVGPVRPLFRLLACAVVLVMLMVCVNVANLMLSRVAGRLHELGVRTAFGADRARLVRLMLTESLMLSVVGGALGALLSFVVLKIVVKLNPGDIPRFEEASIDTRVLLFGLLISVATGLVSGIFPALSSSFVEVNELLRRGGRAIAGVSWRARNAMIVAEVAVSVVLLAGAGVLIRSYLVIQLEDKGFALSTLTMSLNVAQHKRTQEQLDSVRREVMDRIRTIPGVLAAGAIDDLPLSRSEDATLIEVQGRANYRAQTASVRQTGGQYFQAMQIPLIAGRFLSDGDVPIPPEVPPRSVVVTKSLAKLYFGHPDAAVGGRLRLQDRWSTIVGVVGDVRDASLEKAPYPTLYWQCGLADSIVIRTAERPDAIISSIRKVVSAVDRESRLADIQTMHQYVSDAIARRRFQTVALTVFAGVAVSLALVGLYGLLSYAVRQRAPEIGVRMALGASPAAVLRMVVRYGLTLAAAGLAIGLTSAFALTKGMASLLYGVDAADPMTFIAVPAFILAVALAACFVPAWKAARPIPQSPYETSDIQSAKDCLGLLARGRLPAFRLLRVRDKKRSPPPAFHKHEYATLARK